MNDKTIGIFSNKTGSGFPVITLHGLYGSYENLGMLTRKLSADYQIHALDMRNHGRSFHNDIINYQVMAEDIINYMNTNQITKANLIGHSMGGKIAMELALNYPERINNIIILDIAPVAYKEKSGSTKLVLDSLISVDLTTINSRADADLQLQPNIASKSTRQFLLKNLYRKEDDKKFSWKLNLDAIKKNFANILDKPSGTKNFNGKVLFLRGENSNYVLKEHFALIKDLFPSSEIKTIANTGHWLHVESPKAVLDHITEYLPR